MNYRLEVSEQLQKVFGKLKKKDSVSVEILKRKIKKILQDPYKFKPLRGNMKGLRRVHIGKSFVLIYEILENKKIVRLLDYEHHDKVYY